MTWSMFYLACFLIGVALSVVSFLGNSLHIPHGHLPHLHLSHTHATGLAHTYAGNGNSARMPFINFSSLTAFLAWFGAAGYLLTEHSALLVMFVMVLATGVGLVGASLVFLFVVKLMLPHDLALDPADYDRVGVLGRVSSSIREGGTGEIIFSQAGTRHTCGARTETGEALPKGAEVVVTRYERGIAYVRRWEELATSSHRVDS